MPKLRHSRLQAKKWSARRVVQKMLFMLTGVLLLFLALGIFSLTTISSNSPPNDLTTSHRRMSAESRESHGLGKRGKQWTEILSWKPRAFLYHNFLSKEECEYLITLARPHMKKSSVIDETGGIIDSSARTSSGMFLSRGQDEIIGDIEMRIADFTFIPEDHGEGLQVLHYEVGQKYDAHHDYFFDPINIKNGGQRTATLLMYLTDVEKGGETVFPLAAGNISSVPRRSHELSECAKQGLSVKPKMGNALLFWSTRPDATVDPLSLHGSCPVIRGNKWSATKWMHLEEFNI